MQSSRAPATKALIFLAICSLLIADTVAFDCISMTGFNLQCIDLAENNSAISLCLLPLGNGSAYDLLCDGVSNCPIDIDEGDLGILGGQSFNPTLFCCELLKVKVLQY